jgi:hypothetical protein
MTAFPKLSGLATTLAMGVALFVLGCGGGGDSTATTGGAGGGGGGGGGSAPNNQVSVVVDSGPAAAGGVANTPYISVTICAHGSSNCQTIDHVSVDIGSSGFRVVSSVLSSTLASALTQAKDGQGRPYVECLQFADGYSWGPVKQADLKVGGETAANIPIEIIGDPAFAGMAPNDCTGTGGTEEDSVATFGANGILGVATFIQDCGPACATAVQSGTYYICPTGAACSGTTIPLAAQVSNPVAAFPAPDNNGMLLTLPSVANTGAATVTGTVTFGVDTESNNMLGSAKVLTVDEVGNFTVIYNNQTLADSFLDSGSNAYFFDDSGIPKCSGNTSGFYCPASIVTRSPVIRSVTGVQTTVQVTVQSADVLFNSNFNAFNDLAGPATSPGLQTAADSFDFGLPFFLGKSVYEVFENASSSGGAGPFVAF